MKEREQAPLDQFLSLVQATFDDTRQWLRDACIEDDQGPSQFCPKNAGDFAQECSPVNQASAQTVVCSSRYEELGQTSPPLCPSESPAAPPTMENIPAAPCMASTLPLPGVSYAPVSKGTNDARSKEALRNIEEAGKRYHAVSAQVQHPEHRPECLGEGKSAVVLELEQKSPGPSSAGMQHDVHAMWQQGEKLEVWSKSQQCWFEGEVIEVFTSASEVGGHKIPRGSYNVRYSESTMKMIWPAHAQELLRPASRISGL